MPKKIDAFSKEQLCELLKSSSSFAEFLDRLGYSRASSAYRVVKEHLKTLGLDCSELEGKRWSSTPKDNEEVFVENSTYDRKSLKSRIINQKIIPYECACCGNSGEWNGKLLSLHLDHINGVNNDNRIENLRFLCPNCHSQTDTYGGKNKA